MANTEVIAPGADILDANRAALREVTRLLRDLHESEAAERPCDYAHLLDKAAAALEHLRAPPASPIGALCTLLREDRAMRQRVRLRCYGEAGA